MSSICSPVVSAGRSEERSWTVGYLSSAGNSVNLLNPNHEGEWERWIQDNYTYEDDGIIHGSDVPESRWTLPIVQGTHENAWLKLRQNFTFPTSLIMSGVARFWLRLPIRVSVNDTPELVTYHDADYIYDELYFFINNTYTGQSFLIRQLHLTNHIPGATLVRHDWMRGRPVLELSLPIYSEVEYELTILGKIREGQQATFYTAYGDIGNDFIQTSNWTYSYYDTIEGETFVPLNNTYPIDLGYYFIFREGLPSSGHMGLKISIPPGKSIYWFQDTRWNETADEMTYYMNIPIGPRTDEMLNMTCRISLLSDAGPQGQVVAITDQWNTTSNIFRFQANLTADNSSWLISCSPNDVQSQTVIVGVQDKRVNPDTYVSQYFTDYSQYHYYSINMLEWRGSNFTNVPRGSRGTGEQPDYTAWEIATLKPVRDYVHGVKLATPEVNYLAYTNQELQQETTNIIIGSYMEDQQKEIHRTAMGGTNEQTFLSEEDVGPLATRLWRITPEIEVRESMESYRALQSQSLYNQIATTLEDGAESAGVVLEELSGIVDDVSGAFSDIYEWGADMIGNIISVVSTLITLAEIALSATLIILTMVFFAVLVLMPGIFMEMIFLIFTEQHDKLYSSIFSIFKGGPK